MTSLNDEIDSRNYITMLVLTNLFLGFLFVFRLGIFSFSRVAWNRRYDNMFLKSAEFSGAEVLVRKFNGRLLAGTVMILEDKRECWISNC
jgi:hypothetical protein